MRKPVMVLLLIWLTSSDESASARQIEMVSAEDQFRSEYLPANLRLRDKLANISLFGKETRLESNGKRYDLKVILRRYGDSLIYSVEEPNPPGFTGDGQISVYCKNPRKIFKLLKKPGSQTYLIETLDKTSDQTLKDSGIGMSLEARLLLMIEAPYLLYARSFASVVKEPTFKILSRKDVQVGGRRLVEVEFTCDGPDRLKINNAKVQFDPKMDWAICKYEVTFPHKTGFEARQVGFVEYTPNLGDRIAPGRIFNQFEMLGPHKITPPFRDLVVTEATGDALSDSQFELAAFGLPDLDPEPSQTSNFLSLRGGFFWSAISLAVVSFLTLAALKHRVPNHSKA